MREIESQVNLRYQYEFIMIQVITLAFDENRPEYQQKQVIPKHNIMKFTIGFDNDWLILQVYKSY